MNAITPALEVSAAVLELGDGDSRVRALDEVSLTVMPGELLAVVGPSGSGKSSLPALTATAQLRLAGRLAGNRRAEAALDRRRSHEVVQLLA